MKEKEKEKNKRNHASFLHYVSFVSFSLSSYFGPLFAREKTGTRETKEQKQETSEQRKSGAAVVR